MSLNSFNEHLGAITLADLEDPEDQESLTDYPPEYDAKIFWTELTRELHYDPSDSKASHLSSHPFRFLQKYIASTLFGQGNTSNIPLNDLFMLWCLKNKRRVNVAHWLGVHMSQISHRTTQSIACGHFITKIGRGIGVFNPKIHRLTLAHTMEKFDCALMSRLDMCRRAGKSWALFYPDPKVGTSAKRKLIDLTEWENSIFTFSPDTPQGLQANYPPPADAADVPPRMVLHLVGKLFMRIQTQDLVIEELRARVTKLEGEQPAEKEELGDSSMQVSNRTNAIPNDEGNTVQLAESKIGDDETMQDLNDPHTPHTPL